VQGVLSFRQIYEQYAALYNAFALDGHESDEEERALLVKHANRIRPHRAIALELFRSSLLG
jgi:hypothetical protein